MTYKQDHELMALVVEDQSTAFLQQKPPWAIRIYKKAGSDGLFTGEESAIFIRFHHATCDGTSFRTAVLPLFLDMRPMPSCNKIFLSEWKRSKAGLTQAAEAVQSCEPKRSSVNETASALEDELHFNGAHLDRRDQRLTPRSSLETIKAMMHVAAGYVSWIFLAPYTALL
jgi:hypothetical protein